MRARDTAHLIVARDRPWQPVLEARLSEARQAASLRSAGLTPERLAELPASGRPEISYESENGGGGASRRATLLMLFAVIYGIFVAAAYMFTRLYGKEPGWGEVRRWLRES